MDRIEAFVAYETLVSAHRSRITVDKRCRTMCENMRDHILLRFQVRESDILGVSDHPKFVNTNVVVVQFRLMLQELLNCPFLSHRNLLIQQIVHFAVEWTFATPSRIVKMCIICNVRPTDITLFIPAVACDFITAAFFEKHFAAFIAPSDKGFGHGFLYYVSRRELVLCLKL